MKSEEALQGSKRRKKGVFNLSGVNGWVPSPVVLRGTEVGLLKDSRCEMSHLSSIPWANTDITDMEALCHKNEWEKRF